MKSQKLSLSGQHDAVNQAKTTLKKQHKSTDADRIVAELRFGFWTSLFDVRYEYQQILWPRLLPMVFRHIPKSFRTRHYLSKQLNHIRNLRNRIFHYEPIWYRADLLLQHQSMFNLLKWLSPITHDYIVLLDHFKELHHRGFTVNRALFTKELLPEISNGES